MDWLMPRAALAAAVAILVPVAVAVVKAKVFTSMPMPPVPVAVGAAREHTSTCSVIAGKGAAAIGGAHPLVRGVGAAGQGDEVSSCTVTNQSLRETGVIVGAVCVSVAVVFGVPDGATVSNGVVVSTPLKLTRLATLSLVPLFQL